MPLLFDDGPRLSAIPFRLIRDYVNDYCGLYFDDNTRFVVERRLKERLRELGLSDFEAYYRYLRHNDRDHSELQNALEVLTTNETYFFRESFQLDAFTEELLPRIREVNLANGRRKLSIWSAGCSSGEEAYTIAMLILESGLFPGWEIRVFGNDISKDVLKTARRGEYQSASFRTMRPDFEHYFTTTESGRMVQGRVRSLCHFGHLNLKDRHRTAVIGKVDVVFCRNVLIYFDEESRKQVLETLFQRTHPGGYLLLGHSESLINTDTEYELVHLKRDLVYRRPSTL